jgi:hypothetical protein
MIEFPAKVVRGFEDVRQNFQFLSGFLDILKKLHTGNGSPENVVIAPVSHLYLRADGGAGTTLYVKESGTGNTGWVGK